MSQRVHLWLRYAGRIVAGTVALLFAQPGAAAPRAQQPPRSAAAADPVALEAMLKRYCISCHNARAKTGGLELESVDLKNVPAGAGKWEAVIRKLRTGAMPPAAAPKPPDGSREALAAYLEGELDRAASVRPMPGRTEPLHRLNRTEYQNAVRDLFDLRVDVSGLLPADDQSYGFDNIAGVLKMSPTLLDRYMSAAREIASLAVGATPREAVADTFRLRSDLSQQGHIDGLPLGTRGGTAVRYVFPRDAEYAFKVELLEFVVGSSALKEEHDLEVAVDGERIALFNLRPLTRALQYQEKPIPDYHVRVPVSAGAHTVTAAFIHKTSALPEALRQPFNRPHGEGDYLFYQPHVSTLTISGPFNASGVSDTAARRRVFTCRPGAAVTEVGCARQILALLARRAYRRPVTASDLRGLLALYAEGRQAGGFEAGIEKAVRAVLVSPDFLFRVETDPAAVGPSGTYRLSDLALASRLSFFLWSSIPDEELLSLAAAGRLREPAELDRQVRRMLTDPRASALATTFGGQWLRLRNVSGTQPNNVTYPNFSDNLRADFVTETELFFDSIVKENRSVVGLLTADYTFVNERLAKFYGIPNVYGSEFRRITLSDDNRRGLLGKASILLTTSYPNRTSPVLRGKWILENVLGTPPPPPPANVPELRANGDGVVSRALNMRERMTQHRANPVCASCHARMDPLGLAMENFDAIGRWRQVDEGGATVDSSGAMPDGTKFTGPAELRNLLVKDPEQFVTVVAEKLLIYALGRGLEPYDAPAVRRIVRDAAASEYRFAAVVGGIAKSVPFTMRSTATTRETLARR